MKTYNDIAVIILAAGKGTRMKSDLAKVLHTVDKKSMVVHVVACASRIAGDNIHVVVGHQAEKVKQEVGRFFNVCFSRQEQLLGTGDAVKSALPDIADTVSDILVLCGDVPLIRADTLIRLIEGHRKEKAKVTVLATDVEDPTGYGRLITDEQNRLHCIREEADASEAEKDIKKINTGIYCFDKRVLVSAIDSLRPDNNQNEYYLTDVVAFAKKMEHKICVVTMDDPREVTGVNTLEDLAVAERLIHQIDR
jgi:UDP-N-acetylglucosamine pyrophosphorylase